MRQNYYLKIVEELKQLNLSFEIERDVNSGKIILNFENCNIWFFEENNGYSIEAEIEYYNYKSSMPLKLIHLFESRQKSQFKLYSLDDYFNIIEKYIIQNGKINNIPNWYLEYDKYCGFSGKIMKMLFSLNISDEIYLKWSKKDENWKYKFKERFTEFNSSQFDFFWSIM